MSYRLIQADARRIPLADKSIQCVITSPPYWGLRDYGVGGQIGLEASPDAFVAEMARVFREVRRILRDDGTCWVNLGDSYCTTPAGNILGANSCLGQKAREHYRAGMFGKTCEGLKPKDLIGIPWRVALALQADGWYLRSDIIWAKPNPMPESVTDRPTKSHEYLFLLSKSERYYFDQEAVREPALNTGGNGTGKQQIRIGDSGRDPGNRTDCPRPAEWAPYSGRNLRTVWTIPTEVYPGAHFATFPRRLVEPCIKAGTSERGCCPECGAPWERVVEREPMVIARSGRSEAMGRFGQTQASGTVVRPASATTTGWRPTCSHAHNPVPCVIFDPFVGSGTTLQVADALGRHGIGTDLNREYLGLAMRRLSRPHAPVPRPVRDEHLPLFA